MDQFARAAIRHWKLFCPRAFDALSDPVAHFTDLDAHSRAIVEEQAKADVERHGGGLRSWSEQRASDLVAAIPYPPREEVFLDSFTDQRIDPRGRFTWQVMPRPPHHLWELLEDPTVPAHLFQQELQSWYETLPLAPWVEHAGPPLPLFEPLTSGKLVREGALRRPEIRSWPEATVVTLPGSDLEDAFRVLADATTMGKPWATGGYIDRGESGLVLPPWQDDGSTADPDELASMVNDCGPLTRGTEYVVTHHRPRVVDYHAVSWSLSCAPHAGEQRPWLLLDIDGVLLRYGIEEFEPSAGIAHSLTRLAEKYDLAWATSWEDRANSLLKRTGLGPWPVVPVVSAARQEPDGFDSPRVRPILDFVAHRPFAWADDQVGRRDATDLTFSRNCLVLRPNPHRGLGEEHVETLLNWAMS